VRRINTRLKAKLSELVMDSDGLIILNEDKIAVLWLLVVHM
jgi:hypothetical protein